MLQPGLYAGRRSESRPEPLIYLSASPKWNDDTMSEEGGVHHLLIRDHKKKVDLVHCTCWAGVRKRWRNTPPYPCIHVRPSTKHTLTCLRAWTHQPFLPSLCSPGSYMYVHIRSHLHVCMRREGLQSAAEPSSWKSSIVLNS